MAKLYDYTVSFPGTIISHTVPCTFNISGGINVPSIVGTFGIKIPFEDINHSDFRWMIRVSVTTDSSGKGTADIRYIVATHTENISTAGSVNVASSLLDEAVVGIFDIEGNKIFDRVSGSFVMLAQVINIINGSFNLTKITSDHIPLGGSFNSCQQLIVGQDTVGNYNLYAIIDGILIKIDIIPDEIKQALITSGVKFT